MNSVENAVKNLYNAEKEQTVTNVLNQIAEEANVVWKPLGDSPNNYSVVEQQKPTGAGALAEIIVNSFDAILMKEFHQKYGKDASPSEFDFKTYQDAADDLLDDTDNHVEVIADGDNGRSVTYGNGEFNITVADTGKGQPKESFDNFVKLMEAGLNKQSWPFTQGMFGMGSHGAELFCGETLYEGAGYRLIASASYEEPEQWTWTIIRRDPDENRTFQYLTIDGEFPSFEGEINEQDYGTVTKHYNFQVPASSEITKSPSVRNDIAHQLVNTPLPITFKETRIDRDSVSGVTEQEESGILHNIREANEVQNVVTERLTSDSLPDFLQGTEVEIALLHDDETITKNDSMKPNTKDRLQGRSSVDNEILFTTGGEKHAGLGEYYLKSRCDLSNTAGDVKVFIDLSDVSGENLIKIFDSDRSGLKDSEWRGKKLKEATLDVIRNNEMLREEEMERRASSEREEFEEDLEEFIDDMVTRSPDIADILPSGVQVPTARDGGTDDYEVESPPTELKIIETYRSNAPNDMWNESEKFTRETALNKQTQQRFEIDAPNQYFQANRGNHTGELHIDADGHEETVVESWGLSNGILSLNLSAPEDADVGGSISIAVTVEREDGDTLSEDFNLKFTEEVEERETETLQQDTSSENEEANAVALPHIEGVSGDQFRSDSLVNIVDSTDDPLKIEVNTDAEELTRFLQQYNWKQKASDLIRSTWVNKLGMYAFVQYYRLSQTYDDDYKAAEATSHAIKGMAPMFLAMEFDEDDIDKMTA